MNVFAKFDEIPTMILQDINETKRYGRKVGLSFVRTNNVKTVYPPTNTVCQFAGGIMKALECRQHYVMVFQMLKGR